MSCPLIEDHDLLGMITDQFIHLPSRPNEVMFQYDIITKSPIGFETVSSFQICYTYRYFNTNPAQYINKYKEPIIRFID